MRRASDRYEAVSKTAKYFARGKLSGDPVYEQALGVLPSGGTLLDIGCGQGLMLALLIETAAPRFDRMIGIETRPRMARLARAAVGDHAEIIEADARTLDLEPCSAALLFDVVQMMSPQEQESMIATVTSMLAPNGVILLREADAAAGWRFEVVRISNRLKSFLIGTWRVRKHYRTHDEWLRCFDRLGLRAEVFSTATHELLGNVLFVARLK